MNGPGRPRLIESQLVIDKLLLYKTQIIFPGDKVLSKKNSLWQRISDELEGKKSAQSLHSYVCNNIGGVRDLINGKETCENKSPPVCVSDSNTNNCFDTSSDSELTDDETGTTKKVQKVTLSMNMNVFKNLVNKKKYRNRKVLKLESGVWQNEISERLYSETKLKCGFNFKNHYLSMDLSTGSAKGMYLFLIR